jgi:16S rRNA processing protein RimM
MQAAWDEMVTVGFVARSHGNQGHVIVNPETDYPDDRFQAGSTVWVRRQGGREAEALEVLAVRFKGERPILALSGIGSIEAAEALAGAELRVPISALHGLPAGSFYRHDLIGCAVVTSAGREVGRVKNVEGPREGSRLVIDGAAGEVLVPLAEGICTRVDLDTRTIVVEPPAGLLDLNVAGPAGPNRGI